MCTPSGLIEVFPMAGATSAATVQELQRTFAHQGLLDTVVTDNSSCLQARNSRSSSAKMALACEDSAVSSSLERTSERAVQVFKTSFKKIREGTVADWLTRALFPYCINPHSTTGLSQAQFMFGRNLNSRLDCMLPDPAARVETQQHQQKESHDQHFRTRKFMTRSICSHFSFR